MSGRLFFALFPDTGAAARLAGWACAVAPPGARLVAPERIHLTLAFLGSVDPATEAVLASAAAAACGPAVDVVVDRVGCWRRAGVLWAGCRRPPAALRALHARLQRGLAPLGFAPDPRPFAPHLTLARRVSAPPALAPIEPVRLRLAALHLVASRTLPAGARYEPRGCWPLAAGAGPPAGPSRGPD